MKSFEEEKEEYKGFELEKKQVEEKQASSYDSVKELEDLKSKGEACQRQVVGLQHFKELSENCLKDIERLRTREDVATTTEKVGEDQLAGVQSELKKCRENLHDRLKVKIEQTQKLHNDLDSCEAKSKADSEQIAKIGSELSECKGSLVHNDALLKCETETNETRKRVEELESEVKEAKVRYEVCQLRQNSTEEGCQNGSTGTDSEIGGYSYIMQILYKYGLI